jgi:hypothetical protein
MRLVVVTALAALLLPSAALAAGPSYVAEGGLGILAHGGKNRFVAMPTGGGTAIARIAVHGGAVRGWATLDGQWGIPQPTLSAHLEGLTRDGRRLIVATVGFRSPTQFAVIDTKSLRVRDRFKLNGRFAYDALSPDGRTLYLIQYIDADNISRYIVRAYDLDQHRLLPGRIADKTQLGWVMEGFAVTRVTSADGRWVYTLFTRSGGYPFVHALDAVNGTAHCIGLPWHGSNQDALASMRMKLVNGGTALALHWRSGRPWLTVHTGTWRITHDHAGGGFAWGWTIGGAVAAILAVLGAAAVVLVRQTRKEAVPAL